MGDIKWRNVTPWKSVARSKIAPILYSIRPTMLAAMCRGVSLKRRTLFGSAPFLRKRELDLWMWMRGEIHFHGVMQTNYGAIIAIPNLILWENRKSPEEELNVFDCIDTNCRLKS